MDWPCEMSVTSAVRTAWGLAALRLGPPNPYPLIGWRARSPSNRPSPLLDEVGDREAEVFPDPRHERDLLLRVPASLRVAETPEALHDAVEIVRLEGEDPFPVVETERAGRVREHVGILPPHHAVLREHRSSLRGRQEVPIDRPHVRVDARVLLRRRSLHERGR